LHTTTIENQRLIDSACIVGALNIFLGNIRADACNKGSIMNFHCARGSGEFHYSPFGDGGP